MRIVNIKLLLLLLLGLSRKQKPPKFLLDKHLISAPVEIKSRQSNEQTYPPPPHPHPNMTSLSAENLTILHKMISVASAASPRTKVYCFMIFGQVQPGAQ